MEENKTTYKAYIFCSNCHFKKEIDIPKGALISHVSCPNCGNLTLEIDPNGEIFNRPHVSNNDYR